MSMILPESPLPGLCGQDCMGWHCVGWDCRTQFWSSSPFKKAAATETLTRLAAGAYQRISAGGGGEQM